MFRIFCCILLAATSFTLKSQTWVDSLDAFTRESYLPAQKFNWNWQKAALLRAMVVQQELRPAAENGTYLDYVKKAMDKTAGRARSTRPNSIAPAHGMAFLYRKLKDEKYRKIADKIFNGYLKIPRTSNGGVSHLKNSPELWDDTVYMIGVFLLEMYRTTGDEKYLEELVMQIRAHREKLRDEKWGLWVHGWDGNDRTNFCICGQRRWPDKATRRSSEIWGRGNGWIVVMLADVLQALPQQHAYRNEIGGYLKEMIEHLPELQDKATGHWYQLPVRVDEPDNYIESSCTAMFAYGIQKALELGLVDDPAYRTSIDLAYKGLREHSIKPLKGEYLTTKNVCKGTCIGDKEYYLNRKTKAAKPSGMAMFLIFGLNYEIYTGLR